MHKGHLGIFVETDRMHNLTPNTKQNLTKQGATDFQVSYTLNSLTHRTQNVDFNHNLLTLSNDFKIKYKFNLIRKANSKL